MVDREEVDGMIFYLRRRWVCASLQKIITEKENKEKLFRVIARHLMGK